jgi:hypothetical protein
MGAVQAIPVPDNFLPQRIENTATGPAAQGAEGRIVLLQAAVTPLSMFIQSLDN